MAEEQVKVKIVEEGGQQASQNIDQVADSLEQVGTNATAAQRSVATAGAGLQSMANTASTTAQRVQGVAGSVQQLVSAMGSNDRTAGLISSIAGSTAQFAAMGSMLGPGGTLVGGLAGLAAGLLSVADANRDVEATARAARTALQSLAAQRISDRGAAEFNSEISGGAISGARSASDLALAAESRRIELENLNDEVRNANADFARARDAIEGAGGELSEDRIRNRRAELEGFRRERDRLREELSTLEGETSRREAVAREAARAGREHAAAAAGAHHGAGSPAVTTMVDFNERRRIEDARIMTERLAETAAVNAEELDQTLAAWAEQDRMAAERRQTQADLELENQRMVNEALAEAEQQHQDRILEGRRAMKDAQEELDQQALERRQETSQEMTGMFGNVSMAFGKTIAAIATGEKSADEAFKGLAASFLEMISQYATLKAATEFAEAGGAFARYDYGGGAAHLGAGLAFTAVAVATGVGAAALSAPPQAPARPETTAQQTTGGGGDVVINWNSPVVTAGTEAELGRSLSTLIGVGASI